MEEEIDHDAVCKLCNDHYEWGSSLCEGRRCEEAHEMYLEENEGGKDVKKIKVGDKVVRGPDWIWGGQDGGEGAVGKVICSSMESRWIVRWEDGSEQSYPYRAGEYGLKIISNKTQTTKENNMNISDNILTVFEDSATTAGKIAKRFGSEYGDTTRDLLALKRDKKDLLAILKKEEEAEKEGK